DVPYELHIVRDHDEGLVNIVPGMHDGMLDVNLGDRVHGSRGFIKDHDLRLPDQHLRKRDPVALALRELAWHPVEDLLALLLGKPGHLQGDNGLSHGELLGELETYRIGQVIEHRAVRVEVILLVQQADIFLGPAPLLDAGFGHVYPFLADLNVDLPARGFDEAGDDPRQCGFPCPALSDDAEDLLCVHIERDAVDGLNHAPVDRDIALDQIPRPDDLLARLRVFEGFGVVAAFHELTYHVPGRSDLCDCAIDQQDSTAGHIFDHLREVGRYHHTHVVGLCRFGEHQVDDLCGSGIQRAGRFIGKK